MRHGLPDPHHQDGNDIGTSFRLDKCSRMISKRGKRITTKGDEVTEGSIADIQATYKSLGIPQTNGKHEEVARKSATAKYLQRVRQVLKGWLNEQGPSHQLHALLIIKYPTGIMSWPRE